MQDTVPPFLAHTYYRFILEKVLCRLLYIFQFLPCQPVEFNMAFAILETDRRTKSK
jgi:hypothetical protein